MKIRNTATAMVAFLLVAFVQTALSSGLDSEESQSSMPPSLQQEDDQVFVAVPTASRKQFIERLKSLLEYRRAQQWDRFASLLSIDTLRGRSREQIIQDYQNYPGVAGTKHSLVEFVPKATTLQTEGGEKFIIAGCARLTGVGVSIDAFVVAWRENADWYFSDVNTFRPRDTNFVACSYDKAHSSRPGKHKSKRARH